MTESPMEFVPLDDGSVPKIDLALNKERRSELNLQIESAMNDFRVAFENLNAEESYENLIELLWNTGLPCSDVLGTSSGFKDELSFIKRCYWKNEPISCNAIFEKRPTDRGMCCSFNHEKAEKVFKPSKFSNMISEMQTHEKRMGAAPPHVPDWYTSKQEPFPETGRDYGLTLVVDAHTNKLSQSSVSETFEGFITAVDENSKYPATSLSGLVARPGFVSNIEIEAMKLDIHADVKKMDPTKRNCYLPHEYELNLHQRYSQSNCLLECELEFTSKCMKVCREESEQEEKCGCKIIQLSVNMMKNKSDSCIPWYYPTKDDMMGKICDPWETQMFQKIIQSHIPKDECNHCLPDCSTTLYDAKMSYALFRKCDHTNFGTSLYCDLVNNDLSPAPWMTLADNEFKDNGYSLQDDNELSDSNIARLLNTRQRVDQGMRRNSLPFPTENEKNPTYDAFEKDIGVLNIFFSKKYINTYVTNKRVSLADFLSKIGGSLGFAVGISMISLIETIYWIAFRWLRNLKRNKIQ